MIGNPNLRIMRVRAKVGNLTIIPLIDIGSTHYFVPSKMTKRMGIEILAQRFMRVKVVDDTEINSEGEYADFKFKIQRNHFVSQAIVLPLGGCDVVLGIQWLQELGSIL
jgi:hypothetical protein